jgi:uncharacterized protein
MSTELLFYIRYPQPGQVKTRLAADMGEDGATAFYRMCAEHVLTQARLLSPECALAVHYNATQDQALIQEWVGRMFTCHLQTDGDIGRRMSESFHASFRDGSRSTILFGTDIPDLNADIMRQAARMLVENDVVIGPAADGGYYAIGMKTLHNELFELIPWSTANVFSETRSIAEERGLSIGVLPRLMDIDTFEDLKTWLISEAPGVNETFRSAVRNILPAPL